MRRPREDELHTEQNVTSACTAVERTATPILRRQARSKTLHGSKHAHDALFFNPLTTDDTPVLSTCVMIWQLSARPLAHPQQEPTDELAAPYLAVLSWLWVSLQGLLARLKAFLISDLEDTWASLRGDMILSLVLPWITAALDVAFDQLSTMWM